MSPEVHKYLEKKAVHIHKHAIKKHRDNMKSLEVLVDTCRSQKGTGLPRLAAASSVFTKVDAKGTPSGVLFPLAKHCR